MVKTRGAGLHESIKDSAMSTSVSASSEINLSKLSPEAKELFKCITQYFERIMMEKDKKILKLEDEVTKMRNRIDTLESELDNNAAYLRRETLVMSGNIPDGNRDENCKAVIVSMLQQGINLNISANDISVAALVLSGSKDRTAEI